MRRVCRTTYTTHHASQIAAVIVGLMLGGREHKLRVVVLQSQRAAKISATSRTEIKDLVLRTHDKANATSQRWVAGAGNARSNGHGGSHVALKPSVPRCATRSRITRRGTPYTAVRFHVLGKRRPQRTSGPLSYVAWSAGAGVSWSVSSISTFQTADTSTARSSAVRAAPPRPHNPVPPRVWNSTPSQQRFCGMDVRIKPSSHYDTPQFERAHHLLTLLHFLLLPPLLLLFTLSLSLPSLPPNACSGGALHYTKLRKCLRCYKHRRYRWS